MVKATFRDGTVIEGTPQEIASVLRELSSAPTGEGIHKHGPVIGESRLSDAAVRAIWKRLGPNQQRLLKRLVEAGKPLALTILIGEFAKSEKHPGVDIAGLLAAITRHTNRVAGPTKVTLIEKIRGIDGLSYQINPDVSEILARAVSDIRPKMTKD